MIIERLCFSGHVVNIYLFLLIETFLYVFTFTEKLRRKDIEISKFMEEKELITAEILQIPLEEFKNPQVRLLLIISVIK